MCTIVRRSGLRQDQLPEQSPAKRPKIDAVQPGKLDDSRGAMDLHVQSSNEPEEDKSIGSSSTMSDKEGRPLRRYCTICHENTDHYTDICPHRSKFVGIFCPVCHGPCKNNDDEEHRKTHGEIVIYCDVCFQYAGHWGKDCPEVPLPGYDENLSDYDIGF